MLKNTIIKINSDKSITANYPYKFYQGEINTHKFIIDPSLVINDTSNVVGFIGFRRSDNQKSGFVPLERQQDGTYTYIIKDYWTLNIPNKVWYTIKFASISGDNKLEYQLYAGNSSFPVNPLADYILGDDVTPDTSSSLQYEIDELRDLISTNADNIDTKLNKEFNTYQKLEWDDLENTDVIALNRINQDGTVSQYYAEAEDLYTSVNDIKADENGNIEITGEDIKVSYENNNTITEELDLKVKYSDPVVYYRDVSLPVTEPIITVYEAEIANKAIADANGNDIVDTYATKNDLNSLSQDLLQDISDLNDSLSGDISDTQTQITNLSTSISQNYASKNDLSNGLNGKQDNLTAGTGIQILNNIISSTVEGVKSELVYNGTLTTNNVSFQTNPTFTPKHYIVEYVGNQHYGTQIVRPDISTDLQFVDLSGFQNGTTENAMFDINFYSIRFTVSNSYVASGSLFNKNMYHDSSGYTFRTETMNISARIYAINI